MSKTSEGLEPEKYEGEIDLVHRFYSPTARFKINSWVPSGNFRWFKAKDSSRYELQMEIREITFKEVNFLHKFGAEPKTKWIDLPKVDEA